MTRHLRDLPAATPAMLAVFDDAAVLGHALAFEAALAEAEAAEGLIPPAAAASLAAACAAFTIDPAELAQEAALAGTLAIPLVRHLRAGLPKDVAAVLHKGATSQDLADTVLMRQVKAATGLLLPELGRITQALAALAERHAATPAIGRTLLQDALPISFGLRLAQIAAGIHEAAERLEADVTAYARLQFGGAAGTRAGLGGHGPAVSARLSQMLDLGDAAPWQARRIGPVAIGASLGLVTGALGKFARDVSLLAQNGVAEAREPLIAGRGGSSAMAHKRNPTGCQIALSAALRAPGLVASLFSGLPQEEERGLGGWQAEAPIIADLFLLASGSAAALAVVAEGLEVDTGAIARNLALADLGTDIGESAEITLRLIASIRKN